MIGMDRHTGRPISGIEHLRQCIGDILSTPLGSRRHRPEYGSKLRLFVDLPVNAGWKSAVQAEAARALGRWETRLKLERVVVLSLLDGKINLRVAGEYLGDSVVWEVSV
ncbi:MULTISPECIES: GPW/gp25 family protein [Pseudomonas]|jgi:phage baseplate assembly protein W|uniref:GPW/gp25 family protein n=1 Tax=Pseudomonas TaxID=286 RepID=UPI00110C7D2D|nr:MULTISPECIES: GPW/gp25 family protein [Pseudomonas]MBK3440655.1 GPW/gp25 family protein [Pseudomonas lactis]MDQ0982700.1 phage baseplate assembly protein W [Pseudomonas synxantha]